MFIGRICFLKVVALILLLGMSACATAPERIAVRPSDTVPAKVVGVGADARVFGDASFDALIPQVEFLRQNIVKNRLTPTILAISGGGQNGAYGAGFLTGWSTTATRPEFALVTGVSAGALIAPFAFLGPEYDPVLRELFTGVGSQDIIETRSIFGLFSTGLASTKPLRRLLERFVTFELMADVAAETRRGRELIIATTDLDAQRTNFWNMGIIAESGTEEARQVFINVLLASASIPGLFDPVLIETEVDGQRVTELHVDGGTTLQIFVLPSSVLSSRGIQEPLPGATHYHIVNGQLLPDFKVTKMSTLAIGQQALNTFIKSNARANVVEAFDFADERGVDFNLTYIPPEFTETPEKPFDTEYMTKLFEFGYRNGAQTNWRKRAPFPGDPG